MTPAQGVVVVWLVGALAMGAWIASLFRRGAMPRVDVEGDDDDAARTFNRGVAFGAVLLAALWPISLPFFVFNAKVKK